MILSVATTAWKVRGKSWKHFSFCRLWLLGRVRFMDTVYYTILKIVIYALVILCIGFYIGYVIYRSHQDADRVVIAYDSIAKDLTRIAELVEEHNMLLAKIIDHRKEIVKRRYEYVRK